MNFDIGAFFDGLPMLTALRSVAVLSGFTVVGRVLLCISRHEQGNSMWRPFKGTVLLTLITVALFVAAVMANPN